MLLAPLVSGRKGEYKSIFEEMRHSGYVRVRVDGKIYDLSEEIDLDKQKKHTIEVVVDRLVIRKEQKASTFGDGHYQQVESGHNDLERSELHPYREVAERPALYDVNAEREEVSRVEPIEARQDQVLSLIHI